MSDKDDLHEKAARLLAETYHVVVGDEPWDERLNWSVPKGLFLELVRALDESGWLATPPESDPEAIERGAKMLSRLAQGFPWERMTDDGRETWILWFTSAIRAMRGDTDV